MTATLHHSQIPFPWAYSLTVLVGHDPGNLVQMCHVMGSPGGKQLRQGNDAQSRMPTTTLKVCGAELFCA